MGVEQVQRDGDVVILTPVWHRDRALVIKMFYLVVLFLFSYLNVDEVPLLVVIESELVLLGSESLVVVDQRLHLVTQSSQVKEFLVSQYFICTTSRVNLPVAWSTQDGGS